MKTNNTVTWIAAAATLFAAALTALLTYLYTS